MLRGEICLPLLILRGDPFFQIFLKERKADNELPIKQGQIIRLWKSGKAS